MPTTNYFDHVIDPATGQSIEVRDTYAREQLIHKTEKTTVNSLPPKPTDKESWLAMERFLYYVPVEGQTDQYEAWTLFFVGDPTVASDYTDTDNYKWVKIDTTESDFENFSTKGHTHEVVTEVSVEDHEFVPQGTVSGEFEGTQGTTETDGTHNHTFTPSGNVTSSFSGTQGNTGNAGSHQHSFTPSGSVSSSFSGSQGNTSSEGSHTHSFTPSGDVTVTFEGTEGNTDNDGEHTHTLTKTKKKLSTKKLSVTPATSVDFTGSTTNAQRATGSLETLQSYDASKAVFNGIAVQDGVLSFVTKKMSTADTVSALQASVDASKVTLDNSGTVSQQDVATGQLSDGSANDPTVLADASVDTAGEHSHTFTPAGTAEGTFVGTSGNTGAAGEHQHTFTPSGTVTSTFTGTGGDTGSAGEHNHSFTPSGSVTSSFSGTQGTTGNAGSHTHGFTPSGNVEAGFQGVRTVLKHKVNNGKVRTAPDTEDEGSHAFDWYGILFDEDEMDPHKTRVGNMDMHRMLPIQTKMRRCLLNDDGTVNYYLDDRDSTKKAGSQEGWVTEDETSMSRVETDDIRDSNELVEALKGNSVALNQLAKLPVNTMYTSKVSISDGKVTYVADGNTTYRYDVYYNQNTNIPYVVGHKFYISADLDIDYNGGTPFGVGIAIGGVTNELGRLSTSTRTSSGHVDGVQTVNYIPESKSLIYFNWSSSDDSSAVAGATFVMSNVMVIDLTLLGIDNLTTAAQVKAWLAKNVGLKPYYANNAGSIVNAVMTGVKTTFDGGSNTYPFDVKKVYGQLNGEGEMVQVFPEGMKKAGSVKDTLSASDAVVNVGKFVFPVSPHNVKAEYASYNKPSNMRDVSKNYLLTIGLKKISSGIASSLFSFSENETIINVNIDGVGSNVSNVMKGQVMLYYLKSPLVYTNLVYRDNGVDIPLSEVFFPNGIVVGKGGTVEIQPQNTEEIVTCAPTMTMKKYVLQAGATLDGSDGQVMVEIPEHWRKVYRYLDGTKTMLKAMISPYPQTTTGWIHVNKGYVSAYEASIVSDKLCSISDVKDLELSVVNGKVNASCDVSTIGETGKPADWAAYVAGTHSQLPTTSVTMATLRTAARARGNTGEYKWNMLVYEQYLALYWLFVIEYANLNSQEAFTTALTSEGFHQGGLGNGVTSVASATWNTFNAYKPFVPCGVTNCLGNHSGEVLMSIPTSLGGGIVRVNSYRGVEMPFGHIWKFADGIKYLGDGTQQAVLRCDNPSEYSSDSSSTNYESIGNNVGSDGYKKKIMVGDDGDINCEAVGGGSNQAYCDYNYQAHTNGTYYSCLLGGTAHDGASAGLAFVSSDHGVSFSYTNVGSRLCFFEK